MMSVRFRPRYNIFATRGLGNYVRLQLLPMLSKMAAVSAALNPTFFCIYYQDALLLHLSDKSIKGDNVDSLRQQTAVQSTFYQILKASFHKHLRPALQELFKHIS